MQVGDRCGMWISLSVVSVIKKGSKVITYEQRQKERCQVFGVQKKSQSELGEW